MPSTTVVRRIDAPVERVFDVVSDISQFSQAIPHIVRVELLSERRSGVGTRFRETRRMGGREASTELEVTEYEPPQRVRIVSDTHGTIWDTVFTTTGVGGGTELRMVMDARAHKLLPRLLNPLVMWMIRKAIAGDMDAVKAYCEA
jgi:uncharacterized protein YndB with AHSA1/START domain